eukprot:jgi/Galph1/3396/GphlegSOOS_G2023.1
METGNDSVTEKRGQSRKKVYWLAVGVTSLIIVGLLVSKGSTLSTFFHEAIQWMASLPPSVRFFYLFLLHTVAVLVCFPGTAAIEIASGFSLGIFYGFLCMHLSKLVAAIIAFGLTRSILYQWTNRQIEKYPKAKRFIKAIADEGWKFVFLLRLSPLPSFVNNYLISLAPISLWQYIMATGIGIVPFLLQLVIFGATAHDAQALPRTGGTGPNLWKNLVLSIGMIGLVYYINRVVRKVLNDESSNNQNMEE